MFQHLFAEMNQMLQEVVADYPKAQGARREELLCKYNLLHRISDHMMDEWLVFAEKLSQFRDGIQQSEDTPEPASPPEAPELSMESFARGQGYYKLLMYPQCIEQFKGVIREYPDSLSARLYLSMAYLQEGELEPAYGHLSHMLDLAKDRKLKAMIYNAMGCIRASQERFPEAQELFGLALQCDPSLPEPNMNLEVCRKRGGTLQYGSQLVSLL